MSVFFHRPRKSYYSRLYIPKKLLPFLGAYSVGKLCGLLCSLTPSEEEPRGSRKEDACPKFSSIEGT